MTTRPTCQFNEYHQPRGCRKRAVYAVAYRYVFGHQITGTGDVPVYAESVTFRCVMHNAVEGAIAQRSISEILAGSKA